MISFYNYKFIKEPNLIVYLYSWTYWLILLFSVFSMKFNYHGYTTKILTQKTNISWYKIKIKIIKKSVENQLEIILFY